VSKDELLDVKYDIGANQRRQAHHEAFLKSIEGKSAAEKGKACTATGWRAEPTPFTGLPFDACLQLTPEPYHLVLENICKPLMLGLFLLLSLPLQRLVELRFHALDCPRSMIKLAFPFVSRLPKRFGMMQVRMRCSCRELIGSCVGSGLPWRR
jgi:hypothetical protein